MKVCLCHQAPVWRMVSHLERFMDCVFLFLGCTNLLELCSLGMNSAHTYGLFGLSLESYQACFIPEK